MSYYYKYDFVSPEPTYALLKEEMRSYFEAGAVDDLMFPTWTERALKKLGKSSYPILETFLEQDCFESKLPPDFKAPREAWLCTRIAHPAPFPIQTPSSYYQQTFCKVTPQYDACDPCSPCFPDVVEVVYKSNEIYQPEYSDRFRRTYLLKPGNISNHHTRHDKHDFPYRDDRASGRDSFDIRDNKFVTNFRHGHIHLLYYSDATTEEGLSLIPDNYYIEEYIKRYIKFMLFEQLANQTTDETFNQIQSKLLRAEKSYDEGWIMADIEIKKQDIYQKQRAIKRDLNRNRMYNIR